MSTNLDLHAIIEQHRRISEAGNAKHSFEQTLGNSSGLAGVQRDVSTVVNTFGLPSLGLSGGYPLSLTSNMGPPPSRVNEILYLQRKIAAEEKAARELLTQRLVSIGLQAQYPAPVQANPQSFLLSGICAELGMLSQLNAASLAASEPATSAGREPPTGGERASKKQRLLSRSSGHQDLKVRFAPERGGSFPLPLSSGKAREIRLESLESFSEAWEKLSNGSDFADESSREKFAKEFFSRRLVNADNSSLMKRARRLR